jgi:uncharacterized membrane protein SpoIIM required for sporulation
MSGQSSDLSHLHYEDSGSDSERSLSVPISRVCASFILATFEAICLFYVAAAKAGLVVLAANMATSIWATFLHQGIFRIPLLLLAAVGSIFNLYLVWNAHRLRNAPAAAWRKKKLTRQQQWRIQVIVLLSLATLTLVGTEIYFHRVIHHSSI